MDRRTFFGALAALPVAACAEPVAAVSLADSYPPRWVNYTATYATISTDEIVEQIKRARAKGLESYFDVLDRSLWCSMEVSRG